MEYDAIVIGAGFAGAVAARELAQRGGESVLVLEQRPHIGGNAYDRLDEAGVLIHQYGPHIFHTNSKRVFDYLSRFTGWRDYQHRVVARISPEGEVIPVPFNLTSLRIAFGEEKGAELEKKLVAHYGRESKVSILTLRENDDPELKMVADYVYEHVFVHYTVKQWGTPPEQIDPATIARVPVFLSEDDRYFQDPYQGIPADGYTALFEKLLDHPNITVLTGVPAKERLSFGDQILLDGKAFEGKVIYTGALDELFDCRFGRLPYRTLDFQFETYDREWFQSRGTVNYTVDEDYTRITEFKYFSGQVLPKTTIVKEYSRAYTGAAGEIPYYAIINPENRALYEQYVQLAKKYPQLYLLGRLAEYRYYNMDAITLKALELSDRLVGADNSTNR